MEEIIWVCWSINFEIHRWCTCLLSLIVGVRNVKSVITAVLNKIAHKEVDLVIVCCVIITLGWVLNHVMAQTPLESSFHNRLLTIVWWNHQVWVWYNLWHCNSIEGTFTLSLCFQGLFKPLWTPYSVNVRPKRCWNIVSPDSQYILIITTRYYWVAGHVQEGTCSKNEKFLLWLEFFWLMLLQLLRKIRGGNFWWHFRKAVLHYTAIY